MSTLISAFQSFLNPSAQLNSAATLSGGRGPDSEADGLTSDFDDSFQPSAELSDQKFASASSADPVSARPVAATGEGSKDSSLSGDDLQGYLAFQNNLVKNFIGIQNKGL